MEPNATTTFGTPAPYGRACSMCARAKAKCITGTGVGAKCERCLRLNKDCQPLQTVRKRKMVTRPSASKTGRLEEKLDGLYKLLQSSNQSASVAGQNAPLLTPQTSTQLSPESLQSPAPSPRHGEDFSALPIQRIGWCHRSIDSWRLHTPTTAPDSSYVTSGTRSTIYHCPLSSLIDGFEPSSEEAEECLNIFRTRMMTYFPFILVPESTTAHNLRRERPFLWICIMSVSSKSTVQQMALGKEIRIALGREILVEGRSNLDLLLGVLVFIAWGHYHMYDRPVITQVTQLAMALVANLGLSKPALKEPTQMILNLDARGCPNKPFNPSTRTTEERRAVLGCFLLSSVVSSYFQRVDALRWTPYLEECVTVLAENKEHPSDSLLLQLVKLQLIVEKIGQAPWQDGHGDITDSARAPPAFYLKALEAHLRDFKVNIPPETQKNGRKVSKIIYQTLTVIFADLLLLCLYSTELRAHEIALSKAPKICNSPGFQRLDSLYVCLNATTSWFELFHNIPSASFVGFSIPIFTQMSYCIIALFRLLTFDDPIWDRGLARDTANLSHILGQIIEKVTQVKVVADLDRGASVDNDTFSVTARTIRSIKTWWDAKLAAESTENIAADETPGDTVMDFADDAWLKDILDQGDYHFDLSMQLPSEGAEI